jgi:[protein-PII] uridylyltransferase
VSFPVVNRRVPRQVRMFTTPTQITYSDDPLQQRTILEIIAGDRPGLLSEIGKVFLAEGIDVNAAKIVTVGERAEDVFFVSDEYGQPLTETARLRLQERLVDALDRREPAATGHARH